MFNITHYQRNANHNHAVPSHAGQNACHQKVYSAIKKNAFESVLMRWMKLEPIIQSEVSQKEKHQYSVFMHIWNLER